MSSALPAVGGLPWWAAGLLGVLNILGIGSLLVAIVKTRPTLKKIANEREANLLSERAAEMEAMRERLARLEAERSIDRHRLNNITQCFDALVLLLETNPERANEALAKVKAMRAQQMKAEAAEKGALMAANIQGSVE